MNNLTTLTNAGDPTTIAEGNFETIDASMAFMLQPGLDPTTNLPTINPGPPVAGTYVKGQRYVDSLLAVWVCIVAGTPGTWFQQQPAYVTADPGGCPAGYLTIRSDLNGRRKYFDGAAWQNCP